MVLANSTDCTVYTLITLWLIKVMTYARVHGAYANKLKSVGQFFLDSGEVGCCCKQLSYTHLYSSVIYKDYTKIIHSHKL